jgi:hypothetical protein
MIQGERARADERPPGLREARGRSRRGPGLDRKRLAVEVLDRCRVLLGKDFGEKDLDLGHLGEGKRRLEAPDVGDDAPEAVVLGEIDELLVRRERRAPRTWVAVAAEGDVREDDAQEREGRRTGRAEPGTVLSGLIAEEVSRESIGRLRGTRANGRWRGCETSQRGA